MNFLKESVTGTGTGTSQERGNPSQRQEFSNALFRFGQNEYDFVMRAYDRSEIAHTETGVKRKYGNAPYFVHPRNATLKLVRLGLTDYEVAAATLLHDTVEDTNTFGQTNDTMTNSQIRAQASANIAAEFSPRTARAVLAVTKFTVDGVEIHTQAEADKKSLAELDAAITQDPAIALVKLADLAHNTQTAKRLPLNKKAKLIREIHDWYLPRFLPISQEPTSVAIIARELMSDIAESMSYLYDRIPPGYTI